MIISKGEIKGVILGDKSNINDFCIKSKNGWFYLEMKNKPRQKPRKRTPFIGVR